MNVIPEMTDPLGKCWDQPKVSEILIDDHHAMMSQEVFDELKEYSCSQPSGAYEGKMWKVHQEADVWFLRWYGIGKEEGYCSTNSRRLVVI